MKLKFLFLFLATILLAGLYIWGFYFFKSPKQVFHDYEKALLDYASQISLQEGIGLKAGFSGQKLTDLKEVALIDLEGDMRSIVADFQKDWSGMKRLYLEYTRKMSDRFNGGLIGSVFTRDDPQYHKLLREYNLSEDGDSYCLLFVPENGGSNFFREFGSVRLYYLERTIWGYRIKWSRSLIDLLLSKDMTFKSV